MIWIGLLKVKFIMLSVACMLELIVWNDSDIMSTLKCS